MTAPELFQGMAEIMPEEIKAKFPWHEGLCILSTRIAMDVGAYFRIDVQPLACQVFICNRQFHQHVLAKEDYDVEKWYQLDGSHSIGIGFDKYETPGRYNGHVIAVADGVYGDFSIRQAERVEQGIVTGPAVIGPYMAGIPGWEVVSEEDGTRLEYYVKENQSGFKDAPDWRDAQRRKSIVGRIIRALR